MPAASALLAFCWSPHCAAHCPAASPQGRSLPAGVLLLLLLLLLLDLVVVVVVLVLVLVLLLVVVVVVVEWEDRGLEEWSEGNDGVVAEALLNEPAAAPCAVRAHATPGRTKSAEI